MIKYFESVLLELPFNALMQTCMPLYNCLCGYYPLVNASALLPSVNLVSGTCGYHTHNLLHISRTQLKLPTLKRAFCIL